ncbi:MAG: hypothetical protein AAGF45_02210 [Pseudomonadota bacterium]
MMVWVLILGAALMLMFVADTARGYTPEPDLPQAGQPSRALDGGIPLGAPLPENGPAGLEELEPHEGDMGLEEAIDVPPPRATTADIRYHAADLPGPVAAARAALIQSAKTGDIEALRPLFAAQRVAPIVAPFGEVDDAVDHLRRQSGDAEGQEILAILIELLEGGYVAVGEGSTRTYVWPYFAEVPLATLTPAQMVEVYRILTSIDVEEVERQGRYTFFRVGIAPDGRLRYFSAGEVE